MAPDKDSVKTGAEGAVRHLVRKAKDVKLL